MGGSGFVVMPAFPDLSRFVALIPGLRLLGGNMHQAASFALALLDVLSLSL